MSRSRFIILLMCFYALLAGPGCKPKELEQNMLTALFADGVRIDHIDSADGSVHFYLTNGCFFRVDPGESSVLTIGLDGYLYKNGMKTAFVASDKVDLPDEMTAGFPESESDILACVEGYSEWAFLLGDGKTATLPKQAHSLSSMSRIRSINHRGYNLDAPENTLSAFRLSRLKGFQYVETDVSFTADGVPVLLHDDTVDRTSDGSGKIYELPYEYVSSLSFGAWKDEAFSDERIPTLESFLEMCAGIGLVPYLELKYGDPSRVGIIVGLVERYGFADSVTYISFFPELLRAVLACAPNARVGYICERVDNAIMEFCNEMRRNGVDIFVDTSNLDSSVARLCENNGIPMEVWTVNSEWVISTMPSYISGVTSDFLNAGVILSGK